MIQEELSGEIIGANGCSFVMSSEVETSLNANQEEEI
jgi:hypothetical protein